MRQSSNLTRARRAYNSAPTPHPLHAALPLRRRTANAAAVALDAAAAAVAAAVPRVVAAPVISKPTTVAPPFNAAAVAGLAPARRGDVVPYAPLAGPEVWVAADFASPREWTVQLTAEHIAELEAAAGALLRSGAVYEEDGALVGLPAFTAADFDLRALGPVLRAAGREVAVGRGFAVLRGLPVARWPRALTLVAYWIMGLHWGVGMPQNDRKHLIGHVKDIGLGNNPQARIYMTSKAQPWHVDSADYVALLCLAEAKEGGDSAWASSGAILNIIRDEAPELLPVLAGPWLLDRKGETAGAYGPVFEMSILHYHKGHAIVSLHDSYYQLAAAKWGGHATLSGAQLAALDKLREVASRPGVAVNARLAPGDVQVLNNHVTLHARSAYRDWESAAEAGSGGGSGSGNGSASRQRHLLWLWLAARPGEGAFPLPDSFRHMWREHARDDRSLVRANGGWAAPLRAGGRVPLEAELGQAYVPPAVDGASEPELAAAPAAIVASR